MVGNKKRKTLFQRYSSYGNPNEPHQQITTMPVWGPGFEVSLDFYINSLVSGNKYGYSWIFTIRELF